jgi:hypothetical protein
MQVCSIHRNSKQGVNVGGIKTKMRIEMGKRPKVRGERERAD